MTTPQQTITINFDAAPLATFADLICCALDAGKGVAGAGKLPLELVRVEYYPSPAGTNDRVIRFYPSDRFLDFAAALFAGDVDLDTVQDTLHKPAPPEESL